MSEADVADRLAATGLAFQNWHEKDRNYIPVGLTALSIHFPDVPGRMYSSVANDDPDILEKANVGWYRTARDGNLFESADPRFLVGAKPTTDARVWQWAVVRLTEPWDIMGAGGRTGTLGVAWCRPGFAMLSLDGEVIVRGDTWENEIGTVRVRTPRHREFLDFARTIADDPSEPPAFRTEIKTWLQTFE
ncbi:MULTISPECIES: hypothetical protein [Actinomadura]|uniref:Uncharacterized protein n=1 Tax=Actinomadura yumaensis TaxID=111807 RepID=A0ABW2CE08_9ACTN|nr:hypothetical protein [Actinomadura sp. J1-007]MWK35642.1 hypothetical protein [Actinomadura sp. J1-007]